MISALEVLETQWISAFWTPDSILFDQAFDNDIFKNCLSTYDTSCKPIPPRCQQKNVIESKHKVIRDIYLRLKVCSDPNTAISTL